MDSRVDWVAVRFRAGGGALHGGSGAYKSLGFSVQAVEVLEKRIEDRSFP